MRTLSYVGFIISSFLFLSCQEGNQQQQAQGPAPYPVIEVPVRTVTKLHQLPCHSGRNSK
ncbi:hypothetical protein [Antarcticibacterium sp. 1MA-6-2]|uniref:hypothetical protein n=1 Tax=Antarcticibacterium sp. 1MA-6-2 TaxID=2908210 RepID=UPI0028831B7B|nr:hypothetical protein [Antarcticibacterium sp. 1MA-6-2]